MAACATCNADVPAEARFCPACGAPYPPEGAQAQKTRTLLFHGDGVALLGLYFGFGVLIVFWSILYWMYRRKIFLRI